MAHSHLSSLIHHPSCEFYNFNSKKLMIMILDYFYLDFYIGSTTFEKFAVGFQGDSIF